MAKWDSKNLEIRSKSVEQTLVPLVTQVIIFLGAISSMTAAAVFQRGLKLFVNARNSTCI